MGLVSLGYLSAQTVLIENDFDSATATDIGPTFQFFGNAAGGVVGTGDPDTGSFTNTAAITNTNGFNNAAKVDVLALAPTATGFELEVVIDSVTNAANLQSNGFFIGVVSGTNATLGGNMNGDAVNNATALFNNAPAAIGFRIGGAGINPTFTFVEDPLDGGFGNAGQVNVNLPDPAVAPVLPPLADIEDGFTVTFSVDNANNYTLTTTGLGTDITGLTGTLDGAGGATPGSTLFSAIQNDLGISISAQGAGVGVEVGSVTLTSIQLLGDVDLNGVVTFFDIPPFLAILLDRSFQFEADIDGDGDVDFFDIAPFIDILFGNP